MPNNDLISRAALLAAYDAAHKGPPGRARKLIEEAPKVGGWISVNDRMPDNGQDVLVYMADWGESRITGCNYYNGVWYDCIMNGVVVIPNITHWMPLPEPPKENN